MAERMRAAAVRIDSGHLSLITHPQAPDRVTLRAEDHVAA
jgi:hypothetical protein